MVTPSAALVLWEPFAYGDGSLLTNSGFLWDNRSGTYGQAQAVGGQLQIASSQTEDVVARLAGAPYARSNSTVLYSSFKIKFAGLPKATPDYFAHFAGGSSLRGRVYAQAAESFPGGFHLLIANGSATNTVHAAMLSTNTSYTVVTRYDVDTATSSLWVNPGSENDPAAVASDPQTAISITSYGFRQDAALGTTVMVDDVKVGLSFAAVTQANSGGGIPLGIQRLANRVVLSWTDPAFQLQSAGAVGGVFTNVPGAASPYTNATAGAARFFRLQR
jgi:hypothetical protein